MTEENRETLTSGRGFYEVHQRLAELKQQGVPVDDARVQAVIARHYEIVSWVWTPNAETYVALGEGYVSDEGFRKNIGQGDDSLVTYLSDAMKVYAAEKLRA